MNKFLMGLCAAAAWTAVRAPAQTLPTGITVVPFYDTSKAGLSFAKDKLSTMGMWEVPGKPEHFLVLGYWGYVWSLYPDTTKTYAPGAIKDYTRKQLANFNNMVMKGWEQGALGAAFDPDFKRNRCFYIIYNKYASASSYHAGITPNGADGPGNAGLVVVERWKLALDGNSLARDTTIFSASHGSGYGSSNMVFGLDGYLYITTDSYSQNSWDSTIYMRKILRIDVSRQDAGKLYAIPPTNPYADVSNPNVKKEIYALGFRNTYSLAADYLTGKLWGAEVGQTTWEEVNIIQPGRNYGWGDGGDGQPSSFGVGIEGPCTNNTATGGAYNGGQKTPYAYTGPQTGGRTLTCANFTNGTWNFSHSGLAVSGTPTALPGTPISCIILSQACRGDPASPFFGYHFVTDVERNYFLAVKEGVSAPQNVGEFPRGYLFSGDRAHNGIISFAEDAYGNLYTVMVSSSSGGAFAWHDIYRLSHPQLKPLSAPRDQVIPVATDRRAWAHRPWDARLLFVHDGRAARLPMPRGCTRAELYSLGGKRLGLGIGDATGTGSANDFTIPSGLPPGALWIRYLP